jgi:cytochrome c oxidase assembly factor CtaG
VGRGAAAVLLTLFSTFYAGALHAHAAFGGTQGRGQGAAIVASIIALATLGYALGLRRIWRRRVRGQRETLLRAGSFAGGLASLAIALLSPLDRWGTQLFSLHMIQHEVLMLIAAPLLVLARPLPLFLWAFGERTRVALASMARSRSVQRFWHVLLAPVFAWLLHALVLWVWHAPPLFDAALRNSAIHDLQHLTFLIAALVFWAAMVESRRPEQQGAAILYLFTTTIHTSVLGALITFATRPWYSAYLETPTHWGLTAQEDQQLGGLIMWVPGSLVFVGIALALLVRWIQRSDAMAPPG